MGYKNTMTEQDMSSLVVVTSAPIQQIEKSEIEAATKRMAVIVPDANLMTTEQLATIAQESILYRTVPGRDVHYFLNKGKLSRVLDYKYLKNFATFKEQILSDTDSATLDDSYRPLTESEKIEHNLTDNHIAAKCTIITQRERDIFGAEVKRWLEMGFDTSLAISTAKEVVGGLGTSAIGAILKSENVPKGWSHMQLAEKLAFKNAVNRKYGLPTADEMAMMAYRMAQRAQPKHWENVDPSLPIEAQAKTANLTAAIEDIKAASEAMTPEERTERLNQNVTILRGDDEGSIGDDYTDITPASEPVQDASPPAGQPKKQPAPKSNGDKSDPWPAKSGPVYEFCEAVKTATLPLPIECQYTSAYHLDKAIGGFGNLADKDNFDAKLSAAVDHAQAKNN